MGKIIGIDLGTTNSSVAIMVAGQPKIIPNSEGSRTTPSIVGFDSKTGARRVGISAKRQAVAEPKNTVASIKRLMGIPFSDSETDRRLVQYAVERTGVGECAVNIMGDHFTPEEISAFILEKMKDSAESYLGEKVTQAVITVPGYINEAQRQATVRAGAIAGLEVLRVISEPIAAALAFCLEKKEDGTFAIFDFGGGVFNISILEISEGVVEVVSSNGNSHLGGDDVDQLLIDWLIEDFQQTEGIDLRKDPGVLQRLKEGAEKAKCELSSTTQTDIRLPFITVEASGPKHIDRILTRASFEGMLGAILQNLRISCEKAIKDAMLAPHEIDEVVLVGGSTRIPKVQDLVKSIFGREPNKSVNPDEVVALGAAVQGGMLSGEVKGILVLDATSLPIGISANAGQMSVIIPRNTTIPTKRSEIFTTAVDDQSCLDIEIYQGDCHQVKGNRFLGNFQLDGLPPAPRGLPQIEVIFDLDANGTIHVTATDQGTGIDGSITISKPPSCRRAETLADRMLAARP